MDTRVKYRRYIKRILLLLSILFIAYLFYSCTRPYAHYCKDELIQEINSPDGQKKLNIYQGPPQNSIMVDFYVIAEIEFLNKKIFKSKVIYGKDHSEFEKANWIDDQYVEIDGTIIDIENPKTWVTMK